MKARILDTGVLRSVRPLDVTAYLRTAGWSEAAPDPQASYWEKDQEGVTVPWHQDWSDYPMMIAQLLESLSRAESRSQLAILRDLTETTCDVIRLRAVAEASDDGSIKLTDGLRLNACGERMMLAAACAAIEPKRAYGKKKPSRATDYVGTLRLGQSERGSFVLCIFARISPALRSTHISPNIPGVPPPLQDIVLDEEPYERRVTLQLATALAELERASSRGVATGRMDAFEEAVPAGVSADLCDAVALLGEDRTSFRHVEIRLNLSPTRPSPNAKPMPVTFSQDRIAVIREAGRILRTRSPIEDYELEGFVRTVSREPTSDQLLGVVRLEASVEGRLRAVDVELCGDDWRKAHEAIESQRAIRCEGELLRDRQPYFLQNGRNVRNVDIQ